MSQTADSRTRTANSPASANAGLALDRVVYTAHVHTTGGREGSARASDGRLDVRLSTPGASGEGTNPEQLFAAGWSACFLSAMKIAAGKMKIAMPPSAAIDTEVDLGTIDGSYALAARLNVSLPGVDRARALELLDAAERLCPYSRSTRGNIDVSYNLV